jgi:hypothetical protein
MLAHTSTEISPATNRKPADLSAHTPYGNLRSGTDGLVREWHVAAHVVDVSIIWGHGD